MATENFRSDGGGGQPRRMFQTADEAAMDFALNFSGPAISENPLNMYITSIREINGQFYYANPTRVAINAPNARLNTIARIHSNASNFYALATTHTFLFFPYRAEDSLFRVYRGDLVYTYLCPALSRPNALSRNTKVLGNVEDERVRREEEDAISTANEQRQRDAETTRRRNEAISTGIFIPKIVSRFSSQPPNLRGSYASRGIMISNPRRIIVHHTGGWMWDNVTNIDSAHAPSGIAYHFLIETGYEQDGQTRIAVRRRNSQVVQGRSLNIGGWHTGPNGYSVSQDAIGIAVAGDFTGKYVRLDRSPWEFVSANNVERIDDDSDGFRWIVDGQRVHRNSLIPPTDINVNGVRQLLVEIIADCLVLFPYDANSNTGIARINYAQQTPPQSGFLRTGNSTNFNAPTVSGIMGHREVAPSICPGQAMNHWAIINDAIDMANRFDGGTRHTYK